MLILCTTYIITVKQKDDIISVCPEESHVQYYSVEIKNLKEPHIAYK